MQGDPLAPSWDGQHREPDRWDRLRDIYEKLRLVLDVPGLRPTGVDDLIEQLEQRLDEAGALFPEPDWLGDGQADGPETAERSCANHVGALLEILSRAVAALAEQRARELASGQCGRREEA